MEIIIKNGFYKCVSPTITTENYNETLDSASVRISHLTEMLDIEPFDAVYLRMRLSETTLYSKWFCIDSYECIEETLDDKTYTYELNLFSCIKRLENIILPNISITPNSENRSIYDYLEQYLNEYGDSSWVFDSSVETRFGVIPCPEMQWNTPTLREVFNDLMMIDDCIATMQNNTISFLDLTERGNEITNYNYIRRSMSSDDYVSEIRMNLQNAMEDDAVVITERLPFTTASENDLILTDNNFVLKTQYPIRNVKHLWLNFYVKVTKTNADTSTTETHFRRYRADLVKLFASTIVKEYQDYITMPIYFKPKLAALVVDESNICVYRNFCLYFQRYSNTINGWNEILETSIFSNQTLYKIIANVVAEKIKSSDETINDISDWRLAECEVEYETTQNMVFSASKNIKPRNKRVIMDNQTNSFVNVKTQANLEYQKANRLGNEQLVINQRTDYFNDVIKLAQTYDDSVVYQVQYQISAFYGNNEYVQQYHVETNALATKNYILQNYFTGIKSHIRTWVNAKDEAITRHELIKDIYRLSYTQTDTTNDNSLYLEPLLNNNNLKPVKKCIFKALNQDDTEINTDYYIIDLITRQLNNSLVFTFGCETNSYVYKTRALYQDSSKIFDINSIASSSLDVDSNFTANYGGVPLDFKIYVDDLYENYGIEFNFVNSFDYGDTVNTSNDNYQTFDITNYTNYQDSTVSSTYDGVLDAYLVSNYPLPIWDDDYSNSAFNTLPTERAIDKIFTNDKIVHHHKDNKEICQYSYQIEFLSDENILIGSGFIKNQQLVKNVATSLEFYISSEMPVEKKKNSIVLDANNHITSFNSVEMTYNSTFSVSSNANNDLIFNFTSGSISTSNYLCVFDDTHALILAFKYPANNTLYLNKEE